MARPGLAWVLNLDAELELAQPGYTPPARVTAQLERYGAASRALLGADDVLVRPGAPVDPRARGRVGRAWCPTPSALALLRSAGAEPEPHPTVDVLRRVNHRRFAFELGGGLPGQRYVEARAELEALLARAERPWLLKRPLAFAGRGQLRAFRALSEKEWQWVHASLRADGLIVEPLVEILLEVSLHGFVFRDGTHELGRPCTQTVTERGVFRDVRLTEPGELSAGERGSLFESAERVARALHSAGYFGPFGIDAHRHRLDGPDGFCALGEINARYTMAFAVGFPRHPGELVL